MSIIYQWVVSQYSVQTITDNQKSDTLNSPQYSYLCFMKTELEHILSTSYKEEMIAFMSSHPECFEEAIELTISDKQPYAWRAAWLLWSCLEENDQRVSPYIERIVRSISSKKDGHQRELLKILEQMDLDEEAEGFVFNICVSLWEAIDKTPSVRYTAFRFMVKIAKKYPDLTKEISFLTQNRYLETLSSAGKKAILKMVNKFS